MSAQQSEVITAVEPTAIADVNTAVAKFDRVAAGITELRTKYQGVLYDVTTSKGIKEACDARAAIRGPRYEVEKVRKECKAPILALGKEIDARAAAITADLLSLEAPIDSQVKAEETRKEEERKAKAEAERQRITAIVGRIDEIKSLPASVANRSAAEIHAAITALVSLTIDATFQELQTSASEAREYMLTKLRQMQADRAAFEAEQERLRVERQELSRQRQEQEAAAKAERERIAAEESEAKRKREAEQLAAALERKRLADEQQAALRAEREEYERIAKQQREAAQAEQARIAQENARAESERRERIRLEDEQRERVAQAECERVADEQRKLQAERDQVEVLRAAMAQPMPTVTAVAAVQSLHATAGGVEIKIQSTDEWQPSAADLIGLVAAEYGVSHATAAKWLREAAKREKWETGAENSADVVQS